MDCRAKTVFLTGASSGIGAALAEHLLRAGCRVWGTARNKSRLSRFPDLHPIEMNLEEPESVRQAWHQALAEAGHFDIVIQNAGEGMVGAIEDVSEEEAQRLWKVLVDGPLLLLKLAAAHLRPRRQGIIIGVSSLAAEMPICFCGHYSAGKAALSALLASLWMELKPFGVHVVDLRPGDIRTAFNDDLPRAIPDDSPYFSWADAAARTDQCLVSEAPSPDLVARAVLSALSRDKVPVILRTASFFQGVMAPLGMRFLSRRRLLTSIRSHYGLSQVDADQP